MAATARDVVLLAALTPVICGCAVMAVTAAMFGAGVSVASTAVEAAVAVGKGAVVGQSTENA